MPLARLGVDPKHQTMAVIVQLSPLQVLEYLAELVVNGPSHPGAVGPPPATLVPSTPRSPGGPVPGGWRDVLVKEGPEGWARAVRAHKGVLVTDTTMCDLVGQC